MPQARKARQTLQALYYCRDSSPGPQAQSPRPTAQSSGHVPGYSIVRIFHAVLTLRDRGEGIDQLVVLIGGHLRFDHVDRFLDVEEEDRDDLGGSVRASLQTTSYRMRDVYNNPSIGGVASPTGSWPLMPISRVLNVSSSLGMDLFTATSSYVTLRANAATGGTGLRLMETGTGADVNAAIMPYMAIVRTK